MKIATFFAGAGGLDRGFEEAGFDVVWANEYDKAIWDTVALSTELRRRGMVRNVERY